MTWIATWMVDGSWELQWGHGAWPWMTPPVVEAAVVDRLASMGPRRMAVDDLGSKLQLGDVSVWLQWGHGAWPWMTVYGQRAFRDLGNASMGPRRMAVDDHWWLGRRRWRRRGFNGATAHGRG